MATYDYSAIVQWAENFELFLICDRPPPFTNLCKDMLDRKTSIDEPWSAYPVYNVRAHFRHLCTNYNLATALITQIYGIQIEVRHDRTSLNDSKNQALKVLRIKSGVLFEACYGKDYRALDRLFKSVERQLVRN